MGWPRIVIATTNRGKIREIRALYADLPVTWIVMSELGAPPVVVEDGASFLENARLKAEAIARWACLPALAEDSGLEVDALDGAPGVYSARFAGEGATDARNVALLLSRLAGMPPEKRAARFRAAAVFWWGGARTTGAFDEAEGVCEGTIALASAGTSGFGYDPVFIPRNETRTFAELGPDVKNRLSHRAQALQRLRPLLHARLSAGATG